MGAGCLVATLVMKHADEAAQDPRLPQRWQCVMGRPLLGPAFSPYYFPRIGER